MRLTLLLIFLLSTVLSFGQIRKHEFEVLRKSEKELLVYDKDTNAAAVILFDIGKTRFVQNERSAFDIVFQRTKRIKVLKDAGTDAGEIYIPFYDDGDENKEKITSLEAHTFNLENGKWEKTTLTQSTVFEERLNKYWKVKKFALPAVKKGSIIEYRYELKSPLIFNLPDWEFQDKIPTRYSEYTVGMIPFYEYAFIAQGIDKFDYKNSEEQGEERSYGQFSEVYGSAVGGGGGKFRDMVHTFVMKYVPAFEDESYITSVEDHIMKIDFQLAKVYRSQGTPIEYMSTWNKINNSLLKDESFGQYIKDAEKLSGKIVKDLALENKSSDEKTKILVNYIKENFEWSNVTGLGTGISAKDFLKKKKGSVCAINLFLCGLLRAADIEAEPLILSTRNHGKVHVDYPFVDFFNYVVVTVKNERMFLVDGTSKYTKYDRIPTRCVNSVGLIVNNDKEPSWLELNANVPSSHYDVLQVSLDPEEAMADVKLAIQNKEYKAFDMRRSFKNDTTKIINYYQEKGFQKINGIKTRNFDKVEKPYGVGFSAKKEISRVGDKLVVNPCLGLVFNENPLRSEDRNYPVDFIYPNSQTVRSSIAIPTGYELSEVPKPLAIEDDLMLIKIDYSPSAEKIDVVATYTFKKGVYPVGDYSQLKSHLETVVDQFNTPLIFQEK